jgi:mediator of RNA polymerase II transcription subunit 13
MAFCIYPGGDDVKSQVSLFVEYLGASYESCKLGAHVRSDVKDSTSLPFEDGLIPVTLTEQDDLSETAVRRLREVCVVVGKHLSTVDWQRKKSTAATGEELPPIDNFIIYMINPFQDGRGIAELCAAFWMLYKVYGATRSPQFQGPRPDLVLQIIPIADVANPSTPVIHESIYFQKLARQVYDRCPPSSSFHDTDPSKLRIVSASAIQLEQNFPKKIMFQLTNEPPGDLLHDNSHLHLAYAVSANGEWVTAAWTCLTGRYQATVSYCLVGGRTFFDVAREIWGVTLEVMSARRVAWRLCVVKVGLMSREELDGMFFSFLFCFRFSILLRL